MYFNNGVVDVNLRNKLSYFFIKNNTIYKLGQISEIAQELDENKLLELLLTQISQSNQHWLISSITLSSIKIILANCRSVLQKPSSCECTEY